MKHNRPIMMRILAAAAMVGATLPTAEALALVFDRTQHDLNRIKAARLKRERKALKRTISP